MRPISSNRACSISEASWGAIVDGSRWARRTSSLAALLPVLYLRGISTGDFEEALAALLGSLPSTEPAASVRLAPEMQAPLTPADRYGALFADASRKTGAGRDVIWLSVIDWHFRIQRPQHFLFLPDDAHQVLHHFL